MVAINSGQRVSSFTQKVKRPETFICDFRQLRAVRRLHPELERKIIANMKLPIIRVSSPSIIRTNVRTPTLTGTVAASADPFYTLADQTTARSLPPHIRRSAVNLLAAALWLGEVRPENVAAAAKTFADAAWKEDSVDERLVSLDAPAFRDGETPLVERLSVGLWS
ncbi:hypothetical protein [Bradyrhizobium sp. CCGE-LA001]|uniref:hypothetical protein n=1 Tax=Bradyrhizobium sp. CCGE-LA001 TaxID=1223566 RepID=UPI00119829DD|nr:hypothetical protein [Bradyrhizobium sp. CCGE-LA001]